MKTLLLYSRPGCHLCEELAADLEPLCEGRAVVEVVDISEDPALERHYGLRIPVLAIGGRELCGYPLDKDAVERCLTEKL